MENFDRRLDNFLFVHVWKILYLQMVAIVFLWCFIFPLGWSKKDVPTSSSHIRWFMMIHVFFNWKSFTYLVRKIHLFRRRGSKAEELPFTIIIWISFEYPTKVSDIGPHGLFFVNFDSISLRLFVASSTMTMCIFDHEVGYDDPIHYSDFISYWSCVWKCSFDLRLVTITSQTATLFKWNAMVLAPFTLFWLQFLLILRLEVQFWILRWLPWWNTCWHCVQFGYCWTDNN